MSLRVALLAVIAVLAVITSYRVLLSSPTPPSARSVHDALVAASKGEGPLATGHAIRWRSVRVDRQRRLGDGAWQVRFSAAPSYAGRRGQRLGFVAVLRMRGEHWRIEQISVEDPSTSDALQMV